MNGDRPTEEIFPVNPGSGCWKTSINCTRFWLITLGACIMWGILMAGAFYLNRPAANQGADWWGVLINEITDWSLWVFYIPLIIWLGRRFQIARPHPIRNALIHLVISLAMSTAIMLVWIVKGWLMFRLIDAEPYVDWLRGGFPESFAPLVLWTTLVYWMFLAGYYAVSYARMSHRRRLRAAQLQTQLAEARLRALRYQLQPHFLFNTLHSVSGLVQAKQNDAAIDMITGLSDLLRYTLDCADTDEVRLSNETEFLKQYVGIEQTRFADRLKVRYDMALDTLEALVPNFILQPLVENSIRHGIAKRVAAGTVEVIARRKGDVLHIEVNDDGPGLNGTTSEIGGNGIGLTVTRSRLSTLYGDHHSLVLKEQPDGGVSAVLRIPYHTEPVSPGAGGSGDD